MKMNISESALKENIVSKTNIPITIISGFLGSGKTTLLNHILTNQKGIKTAVLVNEFGEIGIDNELIIKTEEEMIELSNGCICCSCLLYTSPSPRDRTRSRMPSSA